MTSTLVSYVSYCPDNPAKGRWDQEFIGRVIFGEEWLVPGGFRFIEAAWTPEDQQGRVIVFPCGHYVDHGEASHALKRLRNEVAMLDWAVIIATSDERSTFPWDRFDLPSNARLWVQTPRPENTYPPGTRFFPLGSPTSSWTYSVMGAATNERDIDVFFSGQDTHRRRHECIAMLQQLQADRPDLNVLVRATPGFTQGYPQREYNELMAKARVVPCPSGVDCPESFRVYEALEAGAEPILDGVRPDGGGDRYWDMLGFSGVIYDWDVDGRHMVEALTDHRNTLPTTSARWQQYKRDLAWRLHDDIAEASGLSRVARTPDDSITVVIPTSPIPSHPSGEILRQTVHSVRERLPHAEIHVLFDGVRDEQHHRTDDYWAYVRSAVLSMNADPATVPWLHFQHRHQSGMFRRVLNEIRTPWVLFVEHDTPLDGDIDFAEMLHVMSHDDVRFMRLHHETHIHETSEHLFLETVGVPERQYLRTVQWSQRPHLASTDWYRDIMETYFGLESRTMIEDVMHGIVQQHHVGNRKRLLRGWETWRMAVWAPSPGNIKRSGHLDGRETEEKYDMFIAYDDERPEGAPEPGWWR